MRKYCYSTAIVPTRDLVQNLEVGMGWIGSIFSSPNMVGLIENQPNQTDQVWIGLVSLGFGPIKVESNLFAKFG